MTPRPSWAASAIVMMLVVLAATPALAQREGFQIDRFQAPPSIEDGIARERPSTLKHLRPSVALVLHHESDPLILGQEGVARDDSAIVGSQIVTTLVGALGIGSRLQVSVAVPFALVQGGDRPTLGGTRLPEPHDLKLADPVVGGAFAIIGGRDSSFTLAASIALPIPVGAQDEFLSDGGFGATAKVLAGVHVSRFEVSAGLGYRHRPERTYATDLVIGPELVADAGLYYWIVPELALAAELLFATRLDGAFDEQVTPLEALGGFRYHSGPYSFTVGVGGGLNEAIGSPDLRGIASLGWSPADAPPRRRRPPPPVEGDTDGDGLLDSVDRCPRDREDADRFQDEDGCPDLDNDGDGILDRPDECPNEAEDPDHHDDEDGCPDPDNDADGIPDASDRCPDEPESQNGVEDEDGCPEARVEAGQVRITQRIEFEVDRDVLRAESTPVLEEVARVLRDNAQLRIRIEGHTDDTGTERHNATLSRRRAEAVLRWLVAHGIDRGRLTSQGLGNTRPIEQGTTEEARQKNRRVEFHIVE